MVKTVSSRWLAVLLVCVPLVQHGLSAAAQVAVRHTEGDVHGFFVVKTLQGKTLADGDMTQVAHGDRVTTRLTVHFKDGSVHDETAVFSQRHNFRLLNYHLIQQGSTFPHPIELLIDGSTGQVTVHYTEKGKEETSTDRLKLPPGMANGLIPILLKNISDSGPTTVSMVAPTPKPRLLKLEITPKGDEPFSIGSSSRKATHYVVKAEIGGVDGAMAPLLGKQPPDIHVWILGGEVPALVKMEGPLYLGGPAWRIELACPVWP
jgi:hypothetical protein